MVNLLAQLFFLYLQIFQVLLPKQEVKQEREVVKKGTRKLFYWSLPCENKSSLFYSLSCSTVVNGEYIYLNIKFYNTDKN